LSEFHDVTATDFVDDLVKSYQEVFTKLAAQGAEWIQLDEPELVKDVTGAKKALFEDIYAKLLQNKSGLKVLIQTYFGDVRDVYNDLINLDVEGSVWTFTKDARLMNSFNRAFQMIKFFLPESLMVKTSGVITTKKPLL
jgi:Methionine synthase II (cobalamin-independent)